MPIAQRSPTGRSHDNQRALGIDRPFFDVAHAEQVLVNGTSHRPMDDALGLGVVPQQIALVVGQFVHGASALRHSRLSKK
jgi:hypothetical protein